MFVRLQTQLLSALRSTRAPLRLKLQTRACASTPSALHLNSDHLVVSYEGTQMRLNFVWLRDHCRSASSYNSKTNQRNLDTGSIELNIRPDTTAVEGGHLVLTWRDGHVSKYSLSWLAQNSYERKKQSTVQPRILWNSDIYKNKNVPSAKWEKFMSCDDELKQFLQNYLLYGIAFVDDVPATVEATEAVSKRVSLIRETTYGGMWSFTSDHSRGDSAYSQLALDRHTDTSYFQEPCGIQVFHCLKHEGTGGRTLLVDGFYAAEKLRQRSPENFELLSRVPIGHEYIEKTDTHRNHMSGIGPVLNVYPWNDELYLIRYNNYDRSVINTVPHEVVQRWYAAHRELTTELRRPENELWVKLTPGKVVFIDNWRVMHGRESFTGLRQLCGCYLTRDDVLSAARGFDLQA
ncbi:trimethyllysine dioxygenase, mitochondrial [Platichthys flesus]|uniref:trimethyllysine dioxygenase, mitochondrial n=1 Tax=Platichthys flesus TaxID=8260 RepID=UPI002DBF7222|nr:trimethyllysine dioxygenase, mitochondrial [Platichthys flesus]XP_062262103.1 trimethyllysine dioxygenase, mitochondrial [Platichthys flesus]XP_062262104.1 trimethyllysine dioxygenase, mitochondrial [Platichthys flesus]